MTENIAMGSQVKVTVGYGGFSFTVEGDFVESIERIYRNICHAGNRHLANKVQRAILGIKHESLLSFLEWRYPKYTLLQRGGRAYPVVAFPVNDQLIRDVDCVLVKPLGPPAVLDRRVTKPEYRETVTALDLLIHSGARSEATFAMSQLNVSPAPQVVCGLGSYFDSLDSCEALEWELRTELGKLGTSLPGTFEAFEEERLPLRHRLHQLVHDPVTSGKSRSAAIGGACVVAFKTRRDPRWRLEAQRRAVKGQPLRPGCIHVVPSFMFEAVCNSPYDEFSIRHNLLREFAEELFDRPQPQQQDDWRKIYAYPEVQELERMLNDGRAELYLTGVAVNLLNLRPEICMLLVIREVRWYEEAGPKIRYCKEFSPGNPFYDPSEKIGRVPYCDDDHELADSLRMDMSQTVPAGAAAFWMGIDVLRRLPSF